jgi:hypothetical protein
MLDRLFLSPMQNLRYQYSRLLEAVKPWDKCKFGADGQRAVKRISISMARVVVSSTTKIFIPDLPNQDPISKEWRFLVKEIRVLPNIHSDSACVTWATIR